MNTDTPAISDDFRQRVQAAVAKLRARGETPSVRLVRAEMGSGSPNWITIVLRELRAAEAAEPAREPDAAEAPELAAARLIAPGLLERLRATITAEYEDRIAALQLDVEDARTQLRDQAFVIDDIEAENVALKLRVDDLGKQLVDQVQTTALIGQVLAHVQDLGARHQAFSERAEGAWQAARSDVAGMAGLLQAGVDTQAEIAAGVDAVAAAVSRVATGQASSAEAVIVNTQTCIERILERVDFAAYQTQERDREITHMTSVLRRRLATLTRLSQKRFPQRAH